MIAFNNTSDTQNPSYGPNVNSLGPTEDRVPDYNAVYTDAVLTGFHTGDFTYNEFLETLCFDPEVYTNIDLKNAEDSRPLFPVSRFQAHLRNPGDRVIGDGFKTKKEADWRPC